MSKILFITGGSKGIGNALVKKYQQEGFIVHSFSRTELKNENSVFHHKVDLSDPVKADAIFNQILSEINFEETTSILLINNAGTLGEITTLDKVSPTTIQNAINLNLCTPLAISGSFIKHLKPINMDKRIINISSGAAKKPYEGWSIYCSSKAGIDLATKTIAAEQNNFEYPVTINAIYPGVVETEMQEKIRKTPEQDFKNVQRFIDLKNHNQLFQPDFVADKIFQLDYNKSLENGEIVDIRNL